MQSTIDNPESFGRSGLYGGWLRFILLLSCGSVWFWGSNGLEAGSVTPSSYQDVGQQTGTASTTDGAASYPDRALVVTLPPGAVRSEYRTSGPYYLNEALWVDLGGGKWGRKVSSTWVGKTTNSNWSVFLYHNEVLVDTAVASIQSLRRPRNANSGDTAWPGLETSGKEWVFALSAVTGPTHKTVHGSTNVLNNPGPLTEVYRITVDFATGDDVEQEITLGPGENFTLVVDDERAHVVTFERQREIGDNVGSYWETVGGGSSSSREELVAYTPGGQSQTPGENSYWSGSGSTPLPQQPSITPPAEVRASMSHSDVASQLAAGNTNAESRHVELLSVLTQANDLAAQRSQSETAALIASMERLRLSNRDAVEGLTEDGGDAAQIEDGLLGSAVPDPGAETLLADVWPELDVPSAEAPAITIPLASVGSLAGITIADVDIVVDHETYPWLSTVRAFLVAALGVLFLIALARLLGTLVGMQSSS